MRLRRERKTSAFVVLPSPAGCCYCWKNAEFRLCRHTTKQFIRTIITDEQINFSIGLAEDFWLVLAPEEEKE